MKGFIALAVTSFLVGIQASSISRVQKELAIDESKTVESPWILEELDGTSANGALDAVQNIKTIVDVLHFLRNYKDVKDCIYYSCMLCEGPACILINYRPDIYEFAFCAMYNTQLLCHTTPAQNFKYCETSTHDDQNVELCIEGSNINITGRRACLDLTLSANAFSRTFSICIGNYNHFNNAQLVKFDKQLWI